MSTLCRRLEVIFAVVGCMCSKAYMFEILSLLFEIWANILLLFL